MNQFAAEWKDAENNRIVEYTVAYEVNDSGISIKNLTPTKVSFTNGNRSIGVHTAKGQKMIGSQISSAGQIDIVAQQIAEHHGLMASL